MHHPAVGELAFEHVSLQLLDTPHLFLTVFIPIEGTETSARLAKLMQQQGLHS
jgi:hypothetical protein